MVTGMDWILPSFLHCVISGLHWIGRCGSFFEVWSYWSTGRRTVCGANNKRDSFGQLDLDVYYKLRSKGWEFDGNGGNGDCIDGEEGDGRLVTAIMENGRRDEVVVTRGSS